MKMRQMCNCDLNYRNYLKANAKFMRKNVLVF